MTQRAPYKNAQLNVCVVWLGQSFIPNPSGDITGKPLFLGRFFPQPVKMLFNSLGYCFSLELHMNIKSYDEMIRERRLMLKSEEEEGIEHDEWTPHQIKGIPPPPLEKPYPKDSVLVELASPDCADLGKIPLVKTIVQRRSRRKYSSKALKLEELSFLLYATQRVTQVDEDRVRSKRVVPSGGARHPFETYLIVNRVVNLEPGVYRYLAIEHKLLVVDRVELLSDKISRACFGQSFIGESAVVFVWAAIPYRTEWRYSNLAYKSILIEAGHICQNLYLACEAIGAGACAIAAYNQKAMDLLIGVDGIDEFTVYLAPVGKI